MSDAPIRKMNLPFEGRNYCPEFSPDGKKIAFVRGSLPERSTNYLKGPNFLCIRSLEDGQEKVFPLNHHVFDLRWSQDSSSVMVSGRRGRGEKPDAGRLVMDANTGEISRIKRSSLSAKWSAGGKALFYLQYLDSGCPIISQNIETGKTKEIHRIDRKNRPNLTISPDGKWLAVIEQPMKNPSGKSERSIKVISTESGESRVLCRFEDDSNHMVTPRWSADGRFVIYPRLQRGDEDWELWRVPLNGGQPKQMGISITRAYTISPHPDGRLIAFTSQGLNQRPPGIWVMENFLPDEK